MLNAIQHTLDTFKSIPNRYPEALSLTIMLSNVHWESAIASSSHSKLQHHEDVLFFDAKRVSDSKISISTSTTAFQTQNWNRPLPSNRTTLIRAVRPSNEKERSRKLLEQNALIISRIATNFAAAGEAQITVDVPGWLTSSMVKGLDVSWNEQSERPRIVFFFFFFIVMALLLPLVRVLMFSI